MVFYMNQINQWIIDENRNKKIMALASPLNLSIVDRLMACKRATFPTWTHFTDDFSLAL